MAIFALLYALPRALERTRFLYTASQIPPQTHKPFAMDRAFTRIGGAGERTQVTLAQLAAGQPGGLLINFWATWCPPCLEELPSLENLHRQLQAKNDPNLPKLVTLSVDDAPAEVLSLYKTLKFRPSFPVLHDKEAAFAESVGTTRFPETYWISSTGEVKYRWLGPQNWLSEAVQRQLATR